MDTAKSWDVESSPKGTKINVPWMHAYELQQVVEDIYSPNLELQRRGYEKLLLWKARIDKLPAGIECTIELLHVHILDQEISQQLSTGEKSAYHENDLQLMISSAVMRCINHISHVALTYTDTLASMAQKLNIPKWVVDLRNETAHQPSLPALSKLRLGVKFSLEWLYENYWKETTALPGWVISKSKSPFQNKQIGQLLDVWQALKMYQLNRYEVFNEIPQEDLRNFVTQLLAERKTPLPNQSSNMYFVVRQVSLELLRAIKSNYLKSGSSGIEKFLNVLMDCETFIPPLSIICVGKQENKELENFIILKWLKSFWSNILEPLQAQYSLFPKLIHKLLVHLNGEKCITRQLIMALWIKHLCISMIKSEAVVCETLKKSNNPSDGFSQMQHENIRKKLSGKRFPVKLERRFNKKNPSLKGGFLSFPIDADGNSCCFEVLKFALTNPTEHTVLFLPYLLMVTKPHIPDHVKIMLEQLVSIYVKTVGGNIKDQNSNIHTVEELEERPAESACSSYTDNVFWNMASEYEWSTCPLGLLPWQKETLATLDFPSNVTWTSPEVDDQFDFSEFHGFQVHSDLNPEDKSILHRKVDWIKHKHKQKQGKKKISKKTRDFIKRSKSFSVFRHNKK